MSDQLKYNSFSLENSRTISDADMASMMWKSLIVPPNLYPYIYVFNADKTVYALKSGVVANEGFWRLNDGDISITLFGNTVVYTVLHYDGSLYVLYDAGSDSISVFLNAKSKFYQLSYYEKIDTVLAILDRISPKEDSVISHAMNVVKWNLKAKKRERQVADVAHASKQLENCGVVLSVITVVAVVMLTFFSVKSFQSNQLYGYAGLVGVGLVIFAFLYAGKAINDKLKEISSRILNESSVKAK